MERVSLTDRAQNRFILPRFLYKASRTMLAEKEESAASRRSNHGNHDMIDAYEP